MVKDRMENFESLLVFLDSSIASLFAQNKAMQTALMKATIENQAVGLKCVEMMAMAMNALLKHGQATFTKEEVAELIFKTPKQDVSEDLAAESVNHYPSDQELLDHAIQKINELSIKDVDAFDESIEVLAEIEKTPRNIRVDFSPVRRFLEARRAPLLDPPVDHAHVVKKIEDLKKFRFPAVCKPIIQLTLKSSYAQINQAFQESVGHTGPERRHGKNKPPRRSSLTEIPEETTLEIEENAEKAENVQEAKALSDGDEPMNSPEKRQASSDSELQVTPSKQKIANKHKQPTARKSTTPGKKKKSMESIQGVEISAAQSTELDDTLSEIEDEDEEIQCLAIIKKSEELRNCQIKSELVEHDQVSQPSTSRPSSNES